MNNLKLQIYQNIKKIDQFSLDTFCKKHLMWTGVNDVVNWTEKIRFNVFIQAMFFYPINDDSKRLKFDGEIFLRIHYSSYIVDILDSEADNLVSKNYIFLSKYCKMPYYIGSKRIIFFDSDDALMHKLCDGNVSKVERILNQ